MTCHIWTYIYKLILTHTLNFFLYRQTIYVCKIFCLVLNPQWFLGAGSGIGRAASQYLAKEGAIVVAADKNIANAKETVNLLPKANKHTSLQLSIENKDSVKLALDTVIKAYLKPPSIIVNAAGITRDNFLNKLSEEDFTEVLDVNLKVCTDQFR